MSLSRVSPGEVAQHLQQIDKNKYKAALRGGIINNHKLQVYNNKVNEHCKIEDNKTYLKENDVHI